VNAAGHPRNNFDGMRLIAAFCVLVSHQYALNGLPEPSVLNVHSLGGFGVLIFFSISGFLVTQSWLADPSAWRFAVRRLLRIWPGLALAVALTALVLGPLVSTLSPRDYYADPIVKDYIINNLCMNLRDQLPMRFDGNALPSAINGSMWTIPLELKCYLALALMALAGLLRLRWLLLALVLGATATYALVQPRGELFEHFSWALEHRFLLEFGLFFFAGAVLLVFRVHESRRTMLAVLACCWVLAAVALASGRPLLVLVVPVIVVAIGTASTPVVRSAGRFGDLSYGVYIYAFPVQQTLIWLVRDRLSWGVVLALTVATTQLLAFASWHLVEKKALRLKPRTPRVVPAE
jgi:peptidoglycan/LPS O-acetylase OafA/YrhL